MTARDDGPRSELARYAFGYSDKKPGLAYWLIIAGMVLYILCNLVTVAPAQSAHGVSCETVRRYLAMYGSAAVTAWALRNGYTAAQIAAIRRACRL